MSQERRTVSDKVIFSSNDFTVEERGRQAHSLRYSAVPCRSSETKRWRGRVTSLLVLVTVCEHRTGTPRPAVQGPWPVLLRAVSVLKNKDRLTLSASRAVEGGVLPAGDGRPGSWDGEGRLQKSVQLTVLSQCWFLGLD